MKEFVLEIKKSKFLAYALETKSASEVLEVFQTLKNNTKKANHVCYAYKVVSDGVEQVKFFDDGEPNGTAGKPILSVIEKKVWKMLPFLLSDILAVSNLEQAGL